METQPLLIENIPALLWGPPAERLFIAVHGDQSHKEDAAIALLAGAAAEKGCRTLSFDLPGHGERQGSPRLCKAQNAVEDLGLVMRHARSLSADISLFGCSLGAYFSLVAYQNEPLRQALFLSPVVDMARLIQNMMGWFGVSEERLEREKAVETPAKTLYWDYYQYVLAHPVAWDKPTEILCGEKDGLCEYEVVQRFAKQTHAGLTVLEGGEHYFHTEEQLAFLRRWLWASVSG